MDVKFVYIDPETRRASIQLEPRLVAGIDTLIQEVIMSLLTSQESDLLDPNDGGGLEDLIGSNYDPNDLSEVHTEITRRVAKVETEIINSQIGLDVPAEEKLRNIEIISLAPGRELGSLDLRLRIENEIGRTRDVVI